MPIRQVSVKFAYNDFADMPLGMLSANVVCRVAWRSGSGYAKGGKMSKSIYSLLLTDDVAEAVGKVAAERNMSRSALIDAVLAEYVGVAHTDKLYRDVWKRMQGLFERMQTMSFVNNAQLSLAQVLTVLPFKYNPKVRYLLELSDQPHTVCTVTLNTRTQNPSLTAVLDTFYSRLAALEQRYLDDVGVVYGNGKYTCVLYGDNNDADKVAVEITEYVVTLDGMLRAYIGGDGELADKLFAEYVERHNQALLGGAQTE